MNPASNNSIDERLVVEIVRRVIERLALSSATASLVDRAESTSAPVAIEASKPKDDAAGDWLFTSNVLSTRDIEGRPAGTRRIMVSAKTVVTPAAKDELKARRLELVRGAAASQTGRGAVANSSRKKLVCFSQAHLGKFDPQLMGLPLEVISAEHWSASEWGTRVAPRVADDGQAIVIAQEPYVAVCELNREPGIRAGYAPTSTALGKLIHQLRPNVVVVDARRFTHAMLRTVLEELATQPPRTCSTTSKR